MIRRHSILSGLSSRFCFLLAGFLWPAYENIIISIDNINNRKKKFEEIEKNKIFMTGNK